MAQTTARFAISDLAREFGITPRTIRFWEDQGILAPEREGRNRVFTRRDRPSGFCVPGAATRRVVYAAADGRVHEIRWGEGGAEPGGHL